MKISKAKITDLEAILNLQKEAYVQEAKIYDDFGIQPLTQDITSLKTEWQNGIVIKAEINQKLVGSVRAGMVDDVCKIGKLIVKSEFQNQGIGKRLMTAIEKLFNSCTAYELFTGDKSEKNLALYRKLGYKNFMEEPVSNELILIYLRKKNNAGA